MEKLFANRRNTILFLIIIAVLLAGALVAYSRRNKSPKQAIVQQEDKKLTAEQSSAFNQRIEDLQNQLKNQSLTKQQIFTLNSNLGSEYYGLGKYDLAKNAYLEASRAMPDNDIAWFELYQTSFAMGDYDSARTYLNKALQLSPIHAEYWVASIQLESEHFRADSGVVADMVKKAMKETGNNYRIHEAYAVYLEKISDKPNAIHEWETAQSLNPTQKSYYQQQIQRLKKP